MYYIFTYSNRSDDIFDIVQYREHYVLEAMEDNVNK